MAAPDDPAALAHELRLAIGGLVRTVRAEGAVPLPQLAALGVLDREGPRTTSELAAAAGVRPQSMARTVGGLLDAGMVAGRPHPSDGRKTVLDVTAAGRAALAGERREDRLAEVIAATVPADERHRVTDAAALLRALSAAA
ncbi:MarR family transcriptional regulator [Patulibacter sp. SYSU D01012]|uniref:MarR family winged helix-turn-helix transcriptional regulator n=1 Tax=Patulibacter sp. SYSU D01012 TaxID=2817381 RepID=UPI001B312DDF|nr:MarR family transcriptional regulator [Patulibacter sp. SYSU D01012]